MKSSLVVIIIILANTHEWSFVDQTLHLGVPNTRAECVLSILQAKEEAWKKIMGYNWGQKVTMTTTKVLRLSTPCWPGIQKFVRRKSHREHVSPP